MNRKVLVIGIATLIACMTVFSMAPGVEAAGSLEGYLLNEGEMTTSIYSSGSADYMFFNATLTNRDGYAKVGYAEYVDSDWPGIANVDVAAAGMPASWQHGATTPWNWLVGDVHIVIFEVTDGINGYSGVNYTSSQTLVMPGGGSASPPLSEIVPIPTMSLVSDDGSTLVLEWTAQREDNIDLGTGTPGTYNTMLRYAIYSNVTGSWDFLGYSDADCGDFNAAWDGAMTFTYNDWGTLASGTYGFRLAPVYPWTNHANNASSVYIPRGRGPIYSAELIVSATEVSSNIPLSPEWNLISLDVKNGSTLDGHLMSSDFAGSITGAGSPQFMATWNGTGYEVYTVGGTGDFEMHVGYGYWVYMTDVANATIWGFENDAVDTYALSAGAWNLVGWFNSTTIEASEYVALVGDAGNPRGFITPWDPSGQEYSEGYLEFLGSGKNFTMQPKFGYWMYVISATGVTY